MTPGRLYQIIRGFVIFLSVVAVVNTFNVLSNPRNYHYSKRIHLCDNHYRYLQLRLYDKPTKKDEGESSSQPSPVDDDKNFNLPKGEILDKILEVAIEASKKASEIIKKNSDGADVVDKKSTSRDLLTLVDPQCEKAIRETVFKYFPNHEFLGEEQVEPGIDAAIAALEEKLAIRDTWLWIVDPIDGTTNFASGIPLNMPSVAATYNGEVMVAVLLDPHRDELFTAIRGQGAYLNGEPIHVGSEEKLGDAVVGMESPAGQDSLEQCLKAIMPLMPKVRTIRMLGSSAVMLPWVANGRLTAYWTPDECAWDIAAGALILQEAGGRVTDFEGREFTLRTRSLVGSNGKVHDALLDVIVKEAGL